MREIRVSVLSIILLIIVAVLVFYIFQLRSDLKEAEVAKQKLEILADAQQTNEKFMKAFYSYNSSVERYEKIEKWMTEKGYTSVIPENQKVLDNGVIIKSSISNLKSYALEENKNKMVYYNDCDITISYNGDDTTQSIVTKTILVKEKEQDWKVEEVKLIPVYEDDTADIID